MPTRRQFLAAVSTFALPLFVPAEVFGKEKGKGRRNKETPNEKVNVGLIGCGRRGKQLLGEMPEAANLIAVADCFSPRADEVAGKEHAKAFPDFRRILDRKDIDAVFIATPDHWHALMAILACQAGKDVYCEKPLSLTVREGRRMVEAARKHNRVFQVGTQQRTMKANELACRLVREGALGRVKRVLVNNNHSPRHDMLPGKGHPPRGLDWDMFVGPCAVKVPFNRDYVLPDDNPDWDSFKFFSGGEMTGWGAHGFDMVQWALGMDGTGPVAVQAFENGKDFKEWATVRWHYANGVVVETGNAPKPGGWFFCERGEMHIDRNKFNIVPEGLKKELTQDTGNIRGAATKPHIKNFLECIKTRAKPNADVEVGHRSIIVAHIANIARWTGERLEWNPAKERFKGNRKANGMLDRERRAGYELPEA